MNLKIFFSDITTPTEHAMHELGADVIGLSPHLHSPKKLWQVLLEQVINSIIVGGIAGMSALGAIGWDKTWQVALYAFVMTFLFEMRKYRMGK